MKCGQGSLPVGVMRNAYALQRFQLNAAPAVVFALHACQPSVDRPLGLAGGAVVLRTRQPSRIMSAAFSAIIMIAALGLAFTICGMTEASATRRPSIPCTFSR